MPPKQKAVKMDLGSFLQEGGDSWADDDVDFSSINISATSKPSVSSHGFSGGANPRDPAFGGDSRPRREEQDFPIPDAPPYKARVNNLPWDVDESGVSQWVSDFLKDESAILNLVAPKDFADPSRLKGFAFITFQTQDQLKKALELSGTPLNGRNVYVSVAAPDRDRGFGRRDDGPALDWGSARDSQSSRPPREMRPPREDRPRREEPQLDWGSARDSQFSREPREPRVSNRPPREEPNVDWTAARDAQSSRPPREPRIFKEDRPKREEPDLDWGSARGSAAPSRTHREPRVREDRPKREVFDWGAARDTEASPKQRAPRPQTDRPKRQEPERDWGNARGSGIPSKQNRFSQSSNKATSAQPEKPVAATVKSSFSVLATGDDDDDDEDNEDDNEEEEKEEKAKKAEEATKLEKAVSKLSVEDHGEGWTSVGKK